MLKPNPALPEPEELLLDYAQRLTHHRAGRKALFLALSALAPTTHADEDWRVVENLLAPVIRRRGGEIFRLGNGDVAAILMSADRELTERLTLKLRYLFRDDPLVIKEEKTGAVLLCRWFDLVENYDTFLALARDIEARLHTPDEPQPAPETPDIPTGSNEFRGPRDPFHSPLVRWLTAPPAAPRALERLTLSSVVARLRDGEGPSVAFELFEPQAGALAPLGFPQGDLERNPMLAAAFRSLAMRRLLMELPNTKRPSDSVALIVTLELLLGTEFLALHRAWAIAQWTPLTFLVGHEELLAEPRRYRYVRQMLRKLGHRLGLFDVPLDHLAQRGRLDADMLALSWQSAYGDGGDPRFAALRAALAGGPGDDVLVTGAHSREGLAFARALGAGMIAGRQAALLLKRG